MPFSRMVLVRQEFPDRRLADIPGEVRAEMRKSGFAGRLKPGSRVAVGVGSRGINNSATIVRAVVDYWNAEGMRPFVFPAMGSHGAATPEGQASVLAHYGVTETAMGCPVVSRLDVVSLGKTPEGDRGFRGRARFEKRRALAVGRVKLHTDFSGEIESGLMKMAAIGI